MRNEAKIKKILALLEKLPYFSINNVLGIEPNKDYLKTLFSRHEKAGKLIRIKKAIYTTREYIDGLKRRGAFSHYPEFIAGIIYPPCYLSMDYVLARHNLLTEAAQNFTAVSRNKTSRFANAFGNYFFHKIKDRLFCGFEIVPENGLTVYRATPAKALFDYLYFRKNQLPDSRAIVELRLNLKSLGRADWAELSKYIKIEGSEKMTGIFKRLKEQK